MSDADVDVAAAAAVRYVYHYLFIDSIRGGTFDANLDGVGEETHADWAVSSTSSGCSITSAEG